jgi:hypothetical protein
MNGRWLVLRECDFQATFFSDDWDYLLDMHGQGIKIHFPVKVRHFISWSRKRYLNNAGTITEGARSYLEKLSLNFIKVAA